MKTIFVLVVVAILSGCSPASRQAFANQMEQQNQQIQRQQQQNQQLFTPQAAPKGVDLVCMQRCNAQGYTYGLCKSNCSY